MIRYLSWYPKFHEQYALPTARLDLDTVRTLGHVVRALIVAWTALAVVRWWRNKGDDAAWNAVLLAAVWSSTLYLVLPETRARYAVYAFLGFVPLVLFVVQMPRGPKRNAWSIGFVVAFLLVSGLVPKQAEVLGVGLLGVVALWAFSLWGLGSLPPPRPRGTLQEESPTLP
jgi:hypothetical protein